MDLALLLVILGCVLAAWVICALVVSVLIGRTASVGEHEHQIAELRRDEMRRAKQNEPVAVSTDELVLSA